MIPALDPESDFQPFAKSGSGFRPSKSGIVTPLELTDMMSSSGLFRRLNADSLRTLFVGIVAGIVISSVSVLMLMVTDPKRTRIAEEYRVVQLNFTREFEVICMPFHTLFSLFHELP